MFDEIQRDEFFETIKEEICEAIFALLIMMLPNLEKIQVDTSLMAENYINVAMQKTSILSPNKSRPLSRLKKLEFEVEPYWEQDIYSASSAPFLTLPSLKSLSFSEISERSIPMRVTQNVNITSLEIGRCRMNEKEFFEFLKYFKILRQFVLRSGLCNLDPFWVYSAFYAHSRHTLETLDCSGDEEQDSSPLHSAMGSFVGFDKLKKIDINFCCLSLTPHIDNRSMAEIFPSSIQQIILKRVEFYPDDYELISEKLFNGSISRLSNLRKVILSGTHTIDPDPIVDTLIMIDQLKRKGELAWGFFGLVAMEKRPEYLDYDIVITLEASA